MTILPKKLYHASNFKQTELMPGFYRSNKIQKWDNVETNLFLYATTNKETSISLGFASAIEKKFLLDRYQTDGNVIKISLDYSQKHLKASVFEKLEVFVYAIEPKQNDNWVKNFNVVNNIDTEYKTDSKLINFLSVEKIDLKKWLNNKTIILK